MTSILPDGTVEFRFFRPGATDVKVVGTFNKWSDSAHPMQQSEDGWWVAQTEVASGEHYFRYVADGHWFTDFAANGVERNKYGWNSILIVPERRLRITAEMTEAANAARRSAGAAPDDNDQQEAIAA